ncbi:MAG: gephyrin-like molybdotransferase Glp, partial [Thermodesulfobacteriota bacterium]
LELIKVFSRPGVLHCKELAEIHKDVLAESIIAPHDLPPFSRSSMDGYALRAGDVFGASEFNPAYLDIVDRIAIGVFPEVGLQSGQCAEIVTGGVLPSGADAVVMLEHTQTFAEHEVEVRRTVAPGENIMSKGEDCVCGAQVLAPGSRIRSQEIGLLAALGRDRVSVFRKPRVGIISSGDELVPQDSEPAMGEIRDVNSHTLRCLVADSGADPVVYGIVPDKLVEIKEYLEAARQECDLVLISGGSSVGTRDLTLAAMEEIENCRILAHGVSISPGKPTILADIGGKPVIGLPGQVTSVQVVFLVLVVPLIAGLAGENPEESGRLQAYIRACLGRNLSSKQGREDYVRVRLEHSGEGLPTAVPLIGKSGLLKTMLQADGLIRIPAGQEGLSKKSEVKVFVFG